MLLDIFTHAFNQEPILLFVEQNVWTNAYDGNQPAAQVPSLVQFQKQSWDSFKEKKGASACIMIADLGMLCHNKYSQNTMTRQQCMKMHKQENSQRRLLNAILDR